ncbi:hypothetical protein TNCV_1489191 [Trichonephila clavipes]|nr:hypothetical protein TNCV_1489191 [Trichonephila clavipes]
MSSQSAYFTHVNVFHNQGKPVPIELSIATIPSDSSDPKVMGITVNHACLTSTPKELRSNSPENELLRRVHHPLYPRVYRGIPTLLREGQVEPAGPRRPHGGQRNTTTKIFQDLGVFPMSLETLPDFKDIYDGIFPNSLHEDVHENISYCTIVKSYEFAKYLLAEWNHKV